MKARDTRSLNRAEFALSTAYGIMERRQLWVTLEADIKASKSSTLKVRLQEIRNLNVDVLERWKCLIAVDKDKTLPVPGEEYLDECCQAGFKYARKALWLITAIRNGRHRDLYDQKVKFISFLIDKSEDDRW